MKLSRRAFLFSSVAMAVASPALAGDKYKELIKLQWAVIDTHKRMFDAVDYDYRKRLRKVELPAKIKALDDFMQTNFPTTPSDLVAGKELARKGKLYSTDLKDLRQVPEAQVAGFVKADLELRHGIQFHLY